MKHMLFSILLFTGIVFAQQQPDTAMMSKIRHEGLNNSQAREILSWVADV